MVRDRKNYGKNTLIVCQGNDHPLLYSNIITASQLHWISGTAPDAGKQLAAKIRYRQKDKTCKIEPMNDGSAVIYFDEPVFCGGTWSVCGFIRW